MTSFSARVVKSIIRLYTFPYRRKHMSLSRSLKYKKREYKVPKDFDYSIENYNGIRVEKLMPKDKKSDKIILQFHGGGAVMDMSNGFYRKVAEKYSLITGLSVFTIDYNAGKDKVHPSLLEDCFAAYTGLVDSGINPDDIIATGDSMGGNLMLATCLKLRDEKRQLPKALIAISSFLDNTLTGDSYRKNCYTDPMYALPRYQSYKKYGHLIRRKVPYFANCNPQDPYVSPAFGDYEDFPPVMIICGDCETDESDSDMLFERLKRADVKVDYKKYKGMFHDFLYFAPFIKESKKAWLDIKNFANKNFDD